MKVLIIAIGHPDNVFSLAYHLGRKVDLTVLYVAAGDKYQRGILDLDLSKISTGHYNVEQAKSLFPRNIIDYIDNKFKLELFKFPSFKILSIENYFLLLKINTYIKRKGFDVVHYNGASAFIYWLYLLNKNKRKQFWTLHDYKRHSGEENSRSEKVNKFIARRKKLILVQHYKYLQEAVINEFKLNPSKVRLLRSGTLSIFNAYKSDYSLVPNEDYILYFGRISKYKGVDNLLTAYSGIKNPLMKLVIAGKGQIGKKISNSNIVIYNKYIPTEQLIGLIKKCAFVVVPYIDATHSAVIVTAYEFNKPVIASNIDGINEVVSDNKTGRLINSQDILAWKNVIAELMEDKMLLRGYEENIHKIIKSEILSWETITHEYINLYQEPIIH